MSIKTKAVFLLVNVNSLVNMCCYKKIDSAEKLGLI